MTDAPRPPRQLADDAGNPHTRSARPRAISHSQLLHAFGRPDRDEGVTASGVTGGNGTRHAAGDDLFAMPDTATVVIDLTGDDPEALAVASPPPPARELFAGPPTEMSPDATAIKERDRTDGWTSRAFLSGTTKVRSDRADTTPDITPAPVTSTEAQLPHLPALDGLRGLAVAGVLVFHGGFAWAVGGFLGVSTFFTLSGFLITALLLREHTATHRVALGTFWIRRARRLLPAALASLLLAQIVTLAAGDAGQRKGLGFDTLGALLYGANWRSVLAGQSYGQLFQAPSPLLHFWSLAVEEQFYLFYPLLVFGVLAVLKWNRPRFIAVLIALIAVSLGTMLAVGPALGWSIDRLYYGTDTRMAELLAGALFAALVSHRIGERGLRAPAAVRTAVAGAGAVALVFVLVLWVTSTQESPWLYQGGLALYAIASVAIVAACVLPGGPVRFLLSAAPLQWLGRISYGVYLYHWPVFLLLNPARTGLDGWPLFLLRLAITFPIALASYKWLETPFRRGTALRTLHVRRVAPFVVGSLLMVGIVVSTSAPEAANDFAASQKRFEDAKARATATTAPADRSAATAAADGVTATPAQPVRMGVFGDSTALATGMGLGDYLSTTGEAEPVGAATELGCGIGRGGKRRVGDVVQDIPDRCNQWESAWPDTMRSTGGDLAVVQVGPWDVTDRMLAGDTQWRTVGDPAYDAFLLGEMTKAVDVLSAGCAKVVWLTSPPVTDAAKATGQAEWRTPPPPERFARFNELVKQLSQLRPDKVAVVDLAAWLASSGRDAKLRPDGVHLGDREARLVAQEYLGAAIVDAGRSLPPPQSC